MEVGGWVVFVAVAAFLLYRWRRNGKPDTAALLFIGCFSMFWQEFYADWGAYLYYNPDLSLLPWDETPFTTPNKPVYVLAGYGWFYAGGFALILGLFRRFRSNFPAVPYLIALVVTALIPFLLWNLVTADAVSFITNWYQYLHPVGPAIETHKDGLPLCIRRSHSCSSLRPSSRVWTDAAPTGAPGSNKRSLCSPPSPPPANGLIRSRRGS